MARRKGRFGVILREERIPLPALDNYLLRLVERGKGGAITFDETVMVMAPAPAKPSKLVVQANARFFVPT